MKSFTRLIIAFLLIAIVAVLIIPANANRPTNIGVPYPAGPGTGTVTGHVYTSVNGTTGIADAYIAIVSAMDVNQQYAYTVSDTNGSYHFDNVNASGDNSYRIYANKSPMGEGWSAGVSALTRTILP